MKDDNLYILRSYLRGGESLIKFGYSSDMEARMVSYTSHNPGIEVIRTFHREDAVVFERYIHNKYKSTYKREWYEESFLETVLNEITTTSLMTSYTPVSKRKQTLNKEDVLKFFTTIDSSERVPSMYESLDVLWEGLKYHTKFGVSEETLREFALKNLLNKAVYNRYLKELTYRFTTEDKRLISFRNSLYSTVKVNDTFTNHKIQVLIRKAAETSGLSDLKGFNTSDRECVKLFKMFFEIETEIVRVSSSKLNRNYVVVTIK